jgi:hypothetical protein
MKTELQWGFIPDFSGGNPHRNADQPDGGNPHYRLGGETPHYLYISRGSLTKQTGNAAAKRAPQERCSERLL